MATIITVDFQNGQRAQETPEPVAQGFSIYDTADPAMSLVHAIVPAEMARDFMLAWAERIAKDPASAAG